MPHMAHLADISFRLFIILGYCFEESGKGFISVTMFLSIGVRTKRQLSYISSMAKRRCLQGKVTLDRHTWGFLLSNSIIVQYL